jgi:hypothetical protein
MASSKLPTTESRPARAPMTSVPVIPAQRPTTGVLGLLAAGVPLTLLIDLASPSGPNSAAIYRDEFDAEAVRLFA